MGTIGSERVVMSYIPGKLMRSLNLKTKMTLSVSMVVILFLSLAGYLATAYFERHLRAAIDRNQFLLVSAVANEIDTKLLMYHQQLILAAREVPPVALRNPEAAQRFLDSKSYLSSFFDNHYTILSAAGISIAEAPYTPNRRGKDFSFRPYFKKTVETQKPIISDPYISSQAHSHPAIMMTAPIFNSKGTLAGLLVGSIDLMGDNILGNITKIRVGKKGFISLTTADRIMVMHPDKTRIMKPIPAGNELYDAALEGFEGTNDTVTTGGIPMVTSVKHMKVNGWIVVANLPQAEAYAAIGEMKVYLLAAGAGIVAVVSIIISFLIQRYTRPLLRLTRHVRELSRKEGADKLIRLETDDEIGTLSRAFNTMVAELDQQHEALRESEELFRTLAEQSLVGIYLIQDGLFRYVNPRFAEIFKHSAGEVTDKLGPGDLAHPGDWPDLQGLYFFSAVTKMQDSIDVEVYGSATVYRSRPAIIGTIMDITERKIIEERLKRLVLYDELTGLPNRSLFFDRLHQLLALAKRNQYVLAILFIDLDRFKAVNDTLGHEMGDLLLKEVSRRLTSCTRSSDTVARVGGDEFLGICGKIVAPDDALVIARKISDALSKPFLLRDHEISIGASIGISIYPEDGSDPETLLKKADAAMYRVKEGRKGGNLLYRDMIKTAQS
jgi:diguanylate cyclase (GGDEF)-like protein/PAS domain S-box-containing protein